MNGLKLTFREEWRYIITMISNPKHGWCDFMLSDEKDNLFVGTPSYVTNVPVDLLQAFLDYKTKGQGIAWFNEEGTEFP